jgi:hypothetical protein
MRSRRQKQCTGLPRRDYVTKDFTWGEVDPVSSSVAGCLGLRVLAEAPGRSGWAWLPTARERCLPPGPCFEGLPTLP